MSARSGIRRLLMAGLLALALGGAGATPKPGYIAGLQSPEDIVAIPGSRWILTGGLAGRDGPGSLYLIDRPARSARALAPELAAGNHDRAAFPTCPGPFDPARFSAHGIALREGRAGRHILYVVNHGGREAIEIFALDAARPVPALTWVGCVPLPEGVLANGVAPLPGGAIAATHMVEPSYFPAQSEARSPAAYGARFAAGQPTGHAAVWTARTGWTKLAGTEASGPNGIEASPDGQWIWVANYATREVVRVAAGPGKAARRVAIGLDFLPDNLRWGDDGNLWVAGAVRGQWQAAECAGRAGCEGQYRIARIDPRSQRAATVPAPETLPRFANATTALRVDGELWLATYTGNEIAYFPSAPTRR